MSNQVFVLLRDSAGVPAVVLLMSCKLSFYSLLPQQNTRRGRKREEAETLQYLAKDAGRVMTKSVFIS